jgi:N-methylhydantoinase B/oxoprolinase/acetone carboxylase alpha subunit
MSKRLDPITLEILWGRLIAIMEEAATTLVKTAFSGVIRDSHDYACALFDKERELIAQSPTSTTGLISCVVNVITDISEKYPPESLKDGDVLIWNDPYRISGQTIDLTIVEPIFYKGRLIAYALNIAHHMDMGLATMGTTESVDIFGEGLKIPLCKIQEEGNLREDIVDFIRVNVRVPDMVIGDLRAQFAANRTVTLRVKELVEELGWDDLQDLSREIIGLTEASMRALIREIPDGVYRAERELDPVGKEPVKICLAFHVQGDEITVDCEGTSPQVRSGVNVAINFTRSYLVYPLKCLINPEIYNNVGTLKPITLKVPDGCVLNLKWPAAGYGRTAIAHFLPEICFQALAEVFPGKVIGSCGATPLWVHTFMGKKKGRDRSMAHAFVHGGMGGSSWKDGTSCLAFPCSLANLPVEMLESDLPVVCERKELWCDSGGPGKFRGGLGQELSFVVPDGENAPDGIFRMGIRGGRFLSPYLGILGGKAAPQSEIILNDEPVQTGTGHNMVPGDRLVIRISGGGGYGNPMERDPSAVEQDVLNGYVSIKQAKRDYGVVVNPKTGKVDIKATEKLRKEKVGRIRK